MQMESLGSNTEISLMELFHIFYQKKRVLVLTTLLGLVLGFAVVFFSKPVYEAAIKVTAASEGDIAAFNLGRSWNKSALKPMSAEDIYLIFNNELLSETAKNAFFNQFYLSSLSQQQKEKYSSAQIYASFIKNFAIIEHPKGVSEPFSKFTVAIRGNNPQQVAMWLKQFLRVVQEQTLTKILNNIKQQNSVLVYNLQQQIDRARETAKVERYDRITQLKETMRVAQLARQNEDDLFDSAPNSKYPPNLALLRAEINNLSERKSDDAFIPKLRTLQAELGFYKSLAVKRNQVAVFHLDGTIETPNMPIAPKKRLIMMVALVLGLLAGVFAVMLQIAWRKEQYHKASFA